VDTALRAYSVLMRTALLACGRWRLFRFALVALETERALELAVPALSEQSDLVTVGRYREFARCVELFGNRFSPPYTLLFAGRTARTSATDRP
jgi:hypothetical protein